MSRPLVGLGASDHPRHDCVASLPAFARGLLGRLIRSQMTLLTGLFVLGLATRVWDLGGRSFWFDELISLGVAALDFHELRYALTVERNMPLFHWALFVWVRMVDARAGEAIIRLPSAVIGSAAIPLVFLLGRRLHSQASGLVAAGLLAVNGYHVLGSQEVRGYAAFVTLMLVSYLLLDRALGRGAPFDRSAARDWALHGLVNALAFYCHFFAAFSILAQAVLVLSRRSRVAVIGLIVSGLASAALLVQVLPLLLRGYGGGLQAWFGPPAARHLIELLFDFSGGSGGTLALYLVFAVLGIGLNGKPARYRSWLLLTWFIVPVGLVFGISQVFAIFNGRYLIAVLPALCLLAGCGLVRLPPVARLLGLGAIAAFSFGALRGDLQLRPQEAWREAMTYATANARPGDGWIFISKWGQHGAEYYAGWGWGRNPTAPYADVLEPFDWREAPRYRRNRGLLSVDALEQFSASHSRIWLVLSHEFDPRTWADMAAPVRDWLTQHSYAGTQHQFQRVRVLLYQRQDQT